MLDCRERRRWERTATRITQLKSEGASATKHTHVDVLTARRVKLVRANAAKMRYDALSDHILDRRGAEALAADPPRRLRQPALKLGVTPHYE